MKYTFHLIHNTKDHIEFQVWDSHTAEVIFEYEDEDFEEVGFSLWQLGYMDHGEDVEGLKEYLIMAGFITEKDEVILKK